MPNQLPAAVIFDMGGTLEDVITNDVTHLECAQRTLDFLAQQGVRLDMDAAGLLDIVLPRQKQYHAYSLDSCRELTPFEIYSDWRFKDIPMDRDLLRAIANELAFIWETTFYQRSLRPGTHEMLEELRRRGYRLGVISNTACDSQVFFTLLEYGLLRTFDVINLSSLVGWRKPHPIIFEITARSMGVPLDRCVYVGDTVTRDVIGSRRAGYHRCIRIDSRLTANSDAEASAGAAGGPTREDADFVVQSLLSIPAIMDSLGLLPA
ncbi:MAG: HAD-IA family hydrolase [Lachnospiraceae bacterium]|nr:HAD-IA family hydrolase [Lachnospiraceae bacterium]